MFSDTEILILGKTSWWSQMQCWRADTPNLGNHHFKWNPCGNPCAEAKNRGWHINRTVGHNNQACDGKAKGRVVTKASIRNQWHDMGPILLKLKNTNLHTPRIIPSMISHKEKWKKISEIKEIYSFTTTE